MHTFSRVKKALAILCIVCIAFLLVVINGIFGAENPEATEEQIFTVEKGQGVFEIGRALQDQRIISHRYFFVLYVVLNGDQKTLKAGTYVLNPAMSVRDIAGALGKGETSAATIQIPEGWNMRDIANLLEAQQIVKREEFYDAAGFSEEKLFESEGVSLEGYLFPDTYLMQQGSSAREVVGMMVENFEQKLTEEMRLEIARQGKTIFEVITMASLLEKEVKTKEEKELVAGILWKRLGYGMPLQVDATVTYLIGKKSSRISRVELEIDSPYNTYLHAGLPKGPISNPGLESILAAMYPKESGFWYYLSALDGTTLFSATLEEHNIKKAKYLRQSSLDVGFDGEGA